jgi:glycosyltransferase involved in cell wall biosynthesis
MRVLVVAEFYPRAADPSFGVWAHRQAVAARDAGAEIRVVVLHRPVPPLQAVRAFDLGGALAPVRHPPHAELDGLEVEYVRFVAPPRGPSYASWGAWAARPLRRALGRIRGEFPFDLVHAHYAVPAADALRRALPAVPLVISEHGGDIFHTAARSPGGRRAVETAFRHARLVLANSTAIGESCRELGANAVQVVHLGAELPPAPAPPPADPMVVSVGNLIARKRNDTLLEAIARVRADHPTLRCTIVGDGPERGTLEQLARTLGLDGAVTFAGRLEPAQAVATAQAATVFALPSVDEAFGVAYIEAMAAGVPAIGSRGEPGPEEISAAGGGIRLVEPGDVAGLADAIAALAFNADERAELGRAARATVEREFTWERCGAQTVAAYAEALG